MTAVQAPIHDVLCRVQGEFLEMPGLKLTVAQAQRLWGLDRSTCESLIDKLTESGFLVRTSDGAFLLRTSR